MTTSADEVKGYLRNNWGIDPQFPTLPVFGSGSYRFVDPMWLDSDWFGDFWAATKPRVKWWQRIYRPQVFKCNNWASLASDIAQILNREAGATESLLFGEFRYYRNGDPTDEHSMDIAMLAPDRIAFWEPQTRQRAKWTPDQRCTWYEFL